MEEYILLYIIHGKGSRNCRILIEEESRIVKYSIYRRKKSGFQNTQGSGDRW
jgi:hypothetical protein